MILLNGCIRLLLTMPLSRQVGQIAVDGALRKRVALHVQFVPLYECPSAGSIPCEKRTKSDAYLYGKEDIVHV